ncbi:hypothetical protein lerEdw1_009197, partial [Lerista edwardsae]
EKFKHDPSFRGPIQKRSCTDIICCALFLLFVMGYIVVGFLAWLYGDPRQVIYARNSTGSYCGVGENSNKPFLFYFNLMNCLQQLNVLAAAMKGLQCPTPQVGSFLVPCLRRQLVEALDAKNIGLKIFEDFTRTWYWILIALLIAMLLSLLFLLLLRFLAGTLVWILIVGVLVVTAYGIYHSYTEYRDLNNKGATIQNVGFTTNFSLYGSVKETWLAVLIILCVVEAILLLTLLFLRNRIFIAIELIKEASRYLATSGEPLYRIAPQNASDPLCHGISANKSCNPIRFNASAYLPCTAECIFFKYNEEGLFQRNIFNLQIYNFLSFLWCINFVIALGQCVLAGAFASYYWAFKKPNDIPICAVGSAFIRTLRYHIGSLAFGSLILTIVQAIRLVLEYVDHKLKGVENPVTRCLTCCLRCCFWCLEKFIKFLTRNAYIMIAVYGKNFCTSAREAFKLLMRNIVRVVVLDKITDLLLLFGKLLVVGGVGVLSFFFFTGRIPLKDERFQTPVLNYYWLPILTVVVGSYLIAQGFFTVYNMCIDTLFLCFLEDLERNDGSIEKPYYMSKSLMKILNKKNKKK